MIIEERMEENTYEFDNKPYANQECIWFDDGDYYLTSCHHNFVLMDSTLEDSKEFKYCPYCGRKIKEAKPPLATDEE